MPLGESATDDRDTLRSGTGLVYRNLAHTKVVVQGDLLPIALIRVALAG